MKILKAAIMTSQPTNGNELATDKASAHWGAVVDLGC